MALIPVIPLDQLLAPIPGEAATGHYIGNSQEFSSLRKSLISQIDPRDASGNVTSPNWRPLFAQATDLLTRQSKDLTLAAWLTEVSVRLHGFAGLRDGLRFVRELQERYWDALFPELDEGDLEGRANALAILDSPRFVFVVLSVPLTAALDGGGPYNCQHWRESRDKSASGKTTAEQFDSLLKGTPEAFYVEQGALLDACVRQLDRLDALVDRQYGNEGSTFDQLRRALVDCLGIVDKRRPPPDEQAADDDEPTDTSAPPPVAVVDASEKLELPQNQPVEPGELSELRGPLEGMGLSAPEPALDLQHSETAPSSISDDWQLSRLDEVPPLLGRVASFVLARDLRAPLSYQLLRLHRWGELRASGPELRLALLEAPTSATRLQLKALLANKQWKELLSASEAAMARPEGRGWLDIQFYSWTALTNLGPVCAPLARMIAIETQRLLEEFEQLLDAELKDGTPTANGPARQWLLKSVMTGDARNAGTQHTSDPPMVAPSVPPTPWEQAVALQRVGRFADGIGVLQRQLEKASSGRGRFLAQLEIAELCVLGGRTDLARPFLAELGDAAEQRRLQEWEDPQICVRLWSAQVASNKAAALPIEGDGNIRKLFEQLCRLDITRALTHL